jgi:hypothetical protein
MFGAEVRVFAASSFIALKPDGTMYASFIEGEGERTKVDGKRYNSYTAGSLGICLEASE